MRISFRIIVSLMPVFAFLSGCQSLAVRRGKASEIYDRGNNLRIEKKREEAIEAYREALNILPNMVPARYNLALLLAEGKSSPEALEILKSLEKEDPENLRIRRSLGWASWKAKDVDSAIEYYQSVLSLSPGDKQALQGLSDVYDSIQESEKALPLRKMLARLNEIAENRISLAQTLQNEENWKDALAEYRKILLDEPENVEALIGAGESAQLAKEYRDAAMFFLQAASFAKDAQSANAWWSAAYVELVNNRNFASGLKALDAAIENGFKDAEKINLLLDAVPSAVKGSVSERF